MAADGTALTGRSLLAIFSHPDDESLACGGLLACCAEHGVRVTLVCATRGERGPQLIMPPDVDARLRDVRELELAAAARTLGIAEVVLLDHADGFLPWVDASLLESELRDIITRTRPEVVITFGADGLYWHPDHIAIHHRTTAAVAALGADAPALYYVTMPRGGMRAVVDRLAEADGAPIHPPFGVADPDAFGVLAADPTLVVDVSAFAPRKLAALRCHRTQWAEPSAAPISDGDAGRLFGIEHFHRASVGSTDDSFIERFAARAIIETS